METAREILDRLGVPTGELDLDFIKAAHKADDGRGYVSFTHKTGDRWVEDGSMRLSELDNALPGFYDDLPELVNIYAGVHTMGAPRYGAEASKGFRSGDILRNLCACYSDIDGYNLGYTWKQAQAEVMRLVAAEILPFPSALVFSGQGLYVLWFLSGGYGKEDVERWRFCQGAIYERLKDIGADKKATRSLSQVLRAAGSVHSKTGERVRAMITATDTGYLYHTLDELETYLRVPYIPGRQTPAKQARPKREHKQGRPAPKGDLKVDAEKLERIIPPVRRGKYPARARMFDLCRLAEARGGIVEGNRHYYLWRWACCLYAHGYRGGDLLDIIRTINKRACSPPQPDKELKHACERARDYQYWGGDCETRRNIRGDTIAGELDVTVEEARRLELKAIMPTEERKRRQQTRRAEKERKQAERAEKRAQLETLLKYGRLGRGRLPRQSDLGKQFGVDQATISRWVNEYNERGTLAE